MADEEEYEDYEEDVDPGHVKPPEADFVDVLIPTLDALVKVVAEESQLIAEEVALEVRSIIDEQNFGYPLRETTQKGKNREQLEPLYEKRKASFGYDNKVLIASGNYMNSIAARQLPDGSWEVAPDNNWNLSPIAGGSLITNRRLAWVLELGVPSRNQAPRPHWAVAWQRVKTRMDTQMYQVRVNEKLMKELKKKKFVG